MSRGREIGRRPRGLRTPRVAHRVRPAWVILAGLGVAWLGPGATTAHGQVARWETDVAGSRIRYDSLDVLNAPSLSGLFEWRGRDVLGRMSAGVTGFQNAGWTLQGAADLSGWLPLAGAAGPLHLELAGAASASRHSSDFDTRLLRGDGRLHGRVGTVGAWLGAGIASTRNALDSASVPALVPNVGLWGRFGGLRLTVSYQAPEVQDVRYHETAATVALAHERADVTLFGGIRNPPAGSAIPRETWGGANVDVWLLPGTALTASVGRFPPDVIQGLPGGDFLRVGFRFTTARARPVPESAARAPMMFTGASAARGEISFRVGGATKVEVAGDWNDWTPEPLARDRSGRWVLPEGLQPGLYRFNLRVDGERWTVPDGVPTADDGFGGEVGILIITEDPDA